MATAVPLAAFTLTGHQSLGLIASLGAFTALYGSTLRLGDRLRALPTVAIGFVTASAGGRLCGTNVWLNIACLVAVAAVACGVVFGAGLGPPGPMQFVLVAGVSAHLAALMRLNVAAPNVFAIPALVAVGALSAYLLVISLLALPFMHKAKAEAVCLRALFLPPGRDTESLRITVRVGRRGCHCQPAEPPIGTHHSHWVVMVAGAVLQASHVSRLSAIRAMHRVLGTVLGVAIFGLIKLAEPQGFWLALVLALLQFSIEVVVARHYALALTFITPTALIISAAGGTEDTAVLVAERLVDTLSWVCYSNGSPLDKRMAQTTLTFTSNPQISPFWIKGGNHPKEKVTICHCFRVDYHSFRPLRRAPNWVACNDHGDRTDRLRPQKLLFKESNRRGPGAEASCTSRNSAYER